MAQVQNSNLLNINAGIVPLDDACVVLVKTEWNAAIVDELESGARKVLSDLGIAKVETITVPGAVEIPFAIKARYQSKYKLKPDAFIALGLVLRGDTPHFEYVCESVTQGITQLNLSLSVPSIFGVLTVNTAEQAQERIGGKHGHKGEEAGITAVKMIQINRLMQQP